MAAIDATLNVTLQIEDDVWYETLEAFDGDEEQAMHEIVNSLDLESGYNEYGEWWACFVDNGGWIDPPDDDERPKGGGESWRS